MQTNVMMLIVSCLFLVLVVTIAYAAGLNGTVVDIDAERFSLI